MSWESHIAALDSISDLDIEVGDTLLSQLVPLIEQYRAGDISGESFLRLSGDAVDAVNKYVASHL